jgi:putative AbiEii toxin of type IV toxin-antitoxin system
MYVRRLTITNIRSIESFDLRFNPTEAAGWHVILGANGAGKSSVVRSLALALAGPKEAAALRQNWSTWTRFGTVDSGIRLQVECGQKDVFTKTGRRAPSVDVELALRPIESSIGGPRIEVAASSGSKTAERSIWGTNSGWFSASFGPFRRFTGGDQAFDRLFYSNPRLASHLSAFGEDVALTEGLRWLRDLRVKQLEDDDDDGQLLNHLINFLNNSQLLPHGARISEVRSEEVVVLDAGGARVVVEQLSDGYRSVLSMIFEILRQMTKSYGIGEMVSALDVQGSAVRLPGVVVIDEVDAHLHPSWQKDIGPWFTRCFPEVQFIVTTHSPIICRNATSVWRLANPGTDEVAGRIDGVALNRLIHGSILDAYGTEFFGRDVARSEDSKELLNEMARLNRKALKAALEPADRTRLEELRGMLPTNATDTAAA